MRTAEGLVGKGSRCLCAGIKSRLKYSGAFSLANDKILMDTGRRWPHKLLSARAVRFLKQDLP